MKFRKSQLFSGIWLLAAAFTLPAAEDNDYINIETDLRSGMELQEVADRAYDNREDYWELIHGHERDDHDHPQDETDQHDGTDEKLSAGEAVSEIYTIAMRNNQVVAPHSLDTVLVTIAVIDAWPDCEDTFDALRAAVDLMPDRADEIVATVAVKRDCNCSNGGLWLDRRVDERWRPSVYNYVLSAPEMCSCSQIAMYGGIAGLPENREFKPDMSDAEKLILINRMTERVQAITDRTSAMQSKNGWQCGCTGVNIAASMQGIVQDELRDGTYDRLAEKYTEEVADRGLVVDTFGVVGLYPQEYWGEGATVSRENTLRRKPLVFRGDYLILDPFNPAQEFGGFGDRNFDNIGQHSFQSVNVPTDVFLSEYVDSWNEEALEELPEDREPEQRNRVLELYNGSEETIDLGNDQYLLEIYGGPGTGTPITVVTPPVLVKKTISLQSDVTFDFDKSDIRPEASEDLQNVVKVLNEADLFSEVLIVGHTCDLGSDEYNLALSDRRANSVKDYLQKNDLKVSDVRTEGHGEREPRMPNDSETNRSLNRRVDITFVAREGTEVEKTISEGPGKPKRTEYTFLLPGPGGVVNNVDSQAVENGMVDGEYEEGDMKPRQVIGLNGAIEPGETFVIAYNESDEVLTDAAQLVTGQLDFRPNETLIFRRLGGEMAQHCRAQSYAYITHYPPIPFVRYPDPNSPPPPGGDHLASPN